MSSTPAPRRSRLGKLNAGSANLAVKAREIISLHEAILENRNNIASVICLQRYGFQIWFTSMEGRVRLDNSGSQLHTDTSWQGVFLTLQKDSTGRLKIWCCRKEMQSIVFDGSCCGSVFDTNANRCMFVVAQCSIQTRTDAE